jgi:hypothetical protein
MVRIRCPSAKSRPRTSRAKSNPPDRRGFSLERDRWFESFSLRVSNEPLPGAAGRSRSRERPGRKWGPARAEAPQA